MSRANLFFTPSGWRKATNGRRHAALKHTTTPIAPGQTVVLHRWKKDESSRKHPLSSMRSVDSSQTVRIRASYRIRVSALGERDFCMYLNDQPVSRRAANKLVRKCGYSSIYHFFQIAKLLYGLPYYGQIIIW